MSERSNPLGDPDSVLSRSWKKLKRLHPTAIDLSRVDRIRAASTSSLHDPEALERLIPELGLNDDGMDELPTWLHQSCGQGLRIWQYPIQFNHYLALLAEMGIGSYLELGTRHGGTFVATVEVLNRFHPIERAIGVDIMPCPGLEAYARWRGGIEFHRLNTQSDEFAEWITAQEPFDLVLVDANHDEKECRREVELVRDRAAIVVLHDITNVDFPGVGAVWAELAATGDYTCHEFTAQYEGLGPYMGLGVAIQDGRHPPGYRGRPSSAPHPPRGEEP